MWSVAPVWWCTIWDDFGDLTERILASSPTLAPLGSLAVEHHERLDGSGYPRG